ncbi:MAG: PilZ domain-containing protein [Sumerlaeia bacterium]
MTSKDPLKPIKIEKKEARKIIASSHLHEPGKNNEPFAKKKLSTQEILTPKPIKKHPISQTPQTPQNLPSDGTNGREESTGAQMLPSKKRLELTSLLWGEGENEFATGFDFDEKEDDENPVVEKDAITPIPTKPKNLRDEIEQRRNRRHNKPEGFAPKTPSPTDDELPAKVSTQPRVKNNFERLYNRRECSFPGMITILIPEKTFQPQKYAVRVVDISPSGVRLETRQLDEITAAYLNKDRWYARLEMLVPHRDKLKLRGRLAWARFDEAQSQLGLQFEENCPDIDGLFTDTVNKALLMEELMLRSPIIDPFPSVTPADKFTFSGSVVQECNLIRVQSSVGQIFETIPDKGKFQIDIPLIPNKTNFLSFVALSETKQSIPTPAAILHKVGVAETITYSDNNLVESFEISPTGQHLSMTLSGPPARFFQALKAIEASLANATEITLNLDLRGDAHKAAKKLKHLLPKDHKNAE